MKCKIKRGEEVVVIAGAEKGKRGKVLELIPAKNRVIVEGVRMIKRHTKSRSGDASQNDGGIIEREGTIHYSNVMKADRYDARANVDVSTSEAEPVSTPDTEPTAEPEPTPSSDA